MPPPKKTIIVCLGDSTTAGTPAFLSPLEAPPNGTGNPESQYAFWMMKIHPEWMVLNRGVNGERSDQIRDRFNRDVRDVKPDYAIILAGVNDLYQGYSASNIEDNLLFMYEAAKLSRIIPVAATILPYNTMSGKDYEVLRRLNLRIKSAAESLKIPLCDTYGVVADPRNPAKLVSSPDGLHPHVSGYRRMGEALTHTIEADLARASDQNDNQGRRV